MAAGEGTNEIILGILLTAIGFGSFFLDFPFVCCGFAVFGPILFIVGLYKLLKTPQHPVMYYPPAYPGVPYAPPPPPFPPAPGAPVAPEAPPPVPGPRKCPSCGADNRAEARFCTSCGVPF